MTFPWLFFQDFSVSMTLFIFFSFHDFPWQLFFHDFPWLWEPCWCRVAQLWVLLQLYSALLDVVLCKSLGDTTSGSTSLVPATTTYKWWNCVSSSVSRSRVSLQWLSWLITHQSRNDPRTPRDHGYASCSQEMYTRTLALLQSVNVRCVLAMSQVVGWAIYVIVFLDRYIRSVLVFKTQQSIDELRTGYAALAVHHPLYRNHNRYQHHFQHKLSMGIHSPSCRSTQMASTTNWRN